MNGVFWTHGQHSSFGGAPKMATLLAQRDTRSSCRELTALLLNQYAVFTLPVWFNVGYGVGFGADFVRY